MSDVDPIWLDSLSQASSALNVPVSVLKRAKAAGCPYFKGSRISSEVLEWIDANKEKIADKDKEQLECERLEKQNRKLDLEHQIKLGKFCAVDEVKENWAKGMEIVQKVMSIYIDKSVYNKAIQQMKKELKAMDL